MIAQKDKAKILIVEDDDNLRLSVAEKLSREGFLVMAASDSREALACVRHGQFDLILLDVGLEEEDTGYHFAQDPLLKGTPLIFLSARGAAEERIHGLELGAVDYVTKPFHMRELILRIQKALPRHLVNLTKIGLAVFNFDRYEVTSRGEVSTMSAKEQQLVKFFLENQGKALSRDQILDAVWPEESYPSPRTVDNFIVKLRRWIEEHPDHPRFIQSVRGVGYRLDIQI